MTELELQLKDVIRKCEHMLKSPTPALADARLLVMYARCAEHLTELAFLGALPSPRTLAEDRASQRYEDGPPNEEPKRG